jgi:WD40 repeat protein
MAFSPTGKRLAVCDRDGIIRLIDPHTGRFQLTDNPPTAAKQTAVSPDGKLVATGHACGEVWVWDAASGQPLWHTDPDGEPVREVHFNPTGTTVSAVGFWGPIGVRTWDAKTGKELGPMLPYRYFRTIAVSADGKRIADLIEEKSVMENGKWAYPLFVRTREVATGKEVGRMRLDHRLGLSNESNAVVSRDGRVMVVTHNADGGETIAYDTATGKRLCEMNPSDGALAISADGRLALSASLHKGHIWDTLIGLEIAVFESPLLGTTSLALSPCGRFLLAHFGLVPGAPVTWVFDLRSRQARLFRGQTIAAFFPDGKSILTLPRIRGAERVSLEPLAWKVAPPAKPTDARMNRLWTQLGEPAALDAVFELARHPAEAVPFLKAKLQTDPPDPKAVAAHIGRLGSRLYAEREESTKALRAFGPAVLPALRAALKDGPAPEVRRRLESLLAVLGDTATPFTLARLRAVEVLERCGTPDSRTALKTLAEKQPATPWADAAARALLRLGQE